MKDLFLQKRGCLNQVREPHKSQGVSNLENVYIIELVLYNTKGSASRLLVVVRRTLPPESQYQLVQVMAYVARRYNRGSLPCDSREHRHLVRGCFLAGISLTSCEARTVMGRLPGGMVLPLPFTH